MKNGGVLGRALRYQFYAFDMIKAHLQGCGAPAQHHVLAMCGQLVKGQVYDGEIVYKLYVIMFMHLIVMSSI